MSDSDCRTSLAGQACRGPRHGAWPCQGGLTALLSRRRFLQGCAGAVAAASAGGMPAAAASATGSAGAEGKAMRKAVCHYSFHRRHVAEKWTPDRLAQEVKALGIEGIDYHARMLGASDDAMAAQITAAVAKHGLILSSLSLGNNFNKPKAEEFKAEVEAARKWIQFAARVKAPVSRVFGGSLGAAERKDDAARKAAWQRMIDGLAEIAREAEKCGVVLGVENHGGLPCTAEEQIATIKAVNSKALRATVDVGNYMQGGQEGHVGTALAAPYAAYVHLKDSKRAGDPARPEAAKLVPCVLGEGAVDLAACVAALRKAGYAGFVGLEYEGTEDETTGVPKSVAVMKKLLP
ncbi:MAG: sugar phosphate isomerase/epimerase [Planctomycetes bacterium]|nr:sugar phosphate isomerase/epimerase [Planctomycetota bacterium]